MGLTGRTKKKKKKYRAAQEAAKAKAQQSHDRAASAGRQSTLRRYNEKMANIGSKNEYGDIMDFTDKKAFNRTETKNNAGGKSSRNTSGITQSLGKDKAYEDLQTGKTFTGNNKLGDQITSESAWSKPVKQQTPQVGNLDFSGIGTPSLGGGK